MLSRKVWGFVIVLCVGIGIAITMNLSYYSNPESAHNRSANNVLKVFNPADINPKLVDPSIQDQTKDHTISGFAFQDQHGEFVTKTFVDGKIFVTNFFFTTCAGICPKMTEQLKRVQQEFIEDDNFLILSHTVNPSKDTVETLNKYAERFGAEYEKWRFLTGDKSELYLMARKSYLVVPDEADPDFEHGGESDFLHTENFALIDPEGRIRGMYDGTNPEEVSNLIRDVYDLKKEYLLP